MARVMRQPTLEELPYGPERDFITEVYRLYQMAERPTLRQIEEAITEGAAISENETPGTASRETVRRLLNAISIPHWAAVQAVLRALCELAGIDPHSKVDRSASHFLPSDSLPFTSYEERMKRAWNEALDCSKPYISHRSTRDRPVGREQ